MHATMETQAPQARPATLQIEGQDAWIASEENIADGIHAASAVFASHQADPLECKMAYRKLSQGKELLTEHEARLCLIWDEADYAAFHAITVGWLSRDIDIQITVR